MVLEKREVTIPSWLITALVSIVITVVGYAIGITKVDARAEVEIKNIKENVLRIEASKASKETVNAIMLRENTMQETLLRIENKLDRHIEAQKDFR